MFVDPILRKTDKHPEKKFYEIVFFRGKIKLQPINPTGFPYENYTSTYPNGRAISLIDVSKNVRERIVASSEGKGALLKDFLSGRTFSNGFPVNDVYDMS